MAWITKDARFSNTAWIRQCQECGHIQETKSPNEYKNDSWRDVKCKRCKSEGSLDYGMMNQEWQDN